jgi:hypothetical protein
MGTNKRKTILHDSLYFSGLTLLGQPVLYALAGATTQENIDGTLLSTLIAIPSGILAGYAVDAFRELMDVEDSPRIPPAVMALPKHVKRGLLAASIMGSLAVNGAIYALTPDYHPQASLEKVLLKGEPHDNHSDSSTK